MVNLDYLCSRHLTIITSLFNNNTSNYLLWFMNPYFGISFIFQSRTFHIETLDFEHIAPLSPSLELFLVTWN